MSVTQEKEQQFAQAADIIARVRDEIQSFIVGQEEVVEQVLWSIFSGGHVLLEGLPGLGKTMLIKTIAEVLDLKFSRIQFTPDIMPSDITGTMLLQPDEAGRQTFSFHKGPIFANIILADEINRATPKTQSALLEAMGEKTVTIMGETKRMEKPFFVLATQNPIDMEGTYPLPEAQTDRFICKVNVAYPTQEELKEIARRTTGVQNTHLNKAAGLNDVVALQELTREILVSEDILDYAVWLITATHPDSEDAPETVKEYVQYGSGPRGLQSLINMARARALCSGRFHVSIGDLKNVAYPVLRHRLILNFEGEAAGITADSIIEGLIKENSQGAKS
ncbi:MULTISPECIES: AAA family ATPase [Cytobacillus]|jgi:MoxR-like ATPase|uniref:MoxR family ATPase n=1 Tax=Cytobacillus firmus TaxID=1399 RepID=A0AA46P6S2_CYTFI|nr:MULTISPECIES: MoxR family ATPase [Cytobacillus]KML43794.1 ATPase AAA [Cytobacillus firmus]MCC3645662.1 MoxR family ATPase [Cytobacillus oceanisediminis]MCS0652275.1 MoxR family ATPase [Cytobacillus firmus]MCU1804516.1 MoxR family ATPase [Cytobacillus firmus]UYG96409.1 MoxR family ATPase [Cytobacillus firmus]